MINKDFEEFPEHRTNFFLLLQAINQHCFPALLMIPAEQFKLVIDSVVWAFKHTMRNVAETGLDILYELLRNISSSDVAQQFYQTYYLNLLQHIYSVITDTSHKANFKMHATILAYMISLVEAGSVTVPLYDPSTGSSNNQQFLRDYISNLLKQAFPNLQDSQIRTNVLGLLTLNKDLTAFKNHLRDFLVQIKEFNSEDCTDLYLEEKELELRKVEMKNERRNWLYRELSIRTTV